MDVQLAQENDLRKWAKWVGEVEIKLRESRRLIEDGQKFFTKENIALLAEVALSKNDEKKVMWVAKKY